MFIILIYSVTAISNLYEAKDFNKYPEQLVILEERDAVRLNWDDKEHKVMVRQIYPDKKKVDLTAFITGSEVPFYVTINPKTSLQLDFDQNLEYDLKVSLFNLFEEEGKKIVSLKLEKLEKEPFQEITTKTIIEPKNKPSQSIIQSKIYLLVGIILLSIGIWQRRLLLKTYRKLKKPS